MSRMLFMVSLLLGLTSTSVMADCTKDRPGLLRAADVLMADFETFDEALHEASAPDQVIAIVHHFEEGLLDFMSALRGGATCENAIEEFQHFHEDVMLTYYELEKNPAVFYQRKVLDSWNRVLPSFVRFQNRLYWY